MRDLVSRQNDSMSGPIKGMPRSLSLSYFQSIFDTASSIQDNEKQHKLKLPRSRDYLILKVKAKSYKTNKVASSQNLTETYKQVKE